MVIGKTALSSDLKSSAFLARPYEAYQDCLLVVVFPGEGMESGRGNLGRTELTYLRLAFHICKTGAFVHKVTS